jgi:hypothetical protein
LIIFASQYYTKGLVSKKDPNFGLDFFVRGGFTRDCIQSDRVGVPSRDSQYLEYFNHTFLLLEEKVYICLLKQINMKVFEILLSGNAQTIALVASAETLERAEELVTVEYGLDEEEREDELHIYRSNEISNFSSTGEHVREIFNTNEL